MDKSVYIGVYGTWHIFKLYAWVTHLVVSACYTHSNNTFLPVVLDEWYYIGMLLTEFAITVLRLLSNGGWGV